MEVDTQHIKSECRYAWLFITCEALKASITAPEEYS